MKFLISLVVIALAATAGYFLQPNLYESVERLRPPKPVVVVVAPTPQATAAARVEEAAHTEQTNKVTNLMEQLKKPNPAVATGEPVEKISLTDEQIDEKYPMKKVRAIEDITQNWKFVPQTAFPRKVKASAPINFQLPAGRVAMPVGSDLIAFSLVDGMMTVARGPDDPLKSVVPLASTDFQEMMTGLYTKYVTKLTDDVLKLRERAKFERDNPPPPAPPIDTQTKLAGPKPTYDAEGHVPEMMASIAAKEVVEFKAAKISSWGPPEFTQEDGKSYWTVRIGVDVDSQFGPQSTEILAYILNGKVAKWIYAGSREPVN